MTPAHDQPDCKPIIGFVAETPLLTPSASATCFDHARSSTRRDRWGGEEKREEEKRTQLVSSSKG